MIPTIAFQMMIQVSFTSLIIGLRTSFKWMQQKIEPTQIISWCHFWKFPIFCYYIDCRDERSVWVISHSHKKDKKCLQPKFGSRRFDDKHILNSCYRSFFCVSRMCGEFDCNELLKQKTKTTDRINLHLLLSMNLKSKIWELLMNSNRKHNTNAFKKW